MPQLVSILSIYIYIYTSCSMIGMVKIRYWKSRRKPERAARFFRLAQEWRIRLQATFRLDSCATRQVFGLKNLKIAKVQKMCFNRTLIIIIITNIYVYIYIYKSSPISPISNILRRKNLGTRWCSMFIDLQLEMTCPASFQPCRLGQSECHDSKPQRSPSKGSWRVSWSPGPHYFCDSCIYNII